MATMIVALFEFLRKNGLDQIAKRVDFEVTPQDVISFLEARSDRFLQPKPPSPPVEIKAMLKPHENCWRVFVGSVFVLDDKLLQEIAEEVATRRFAKDYVEVREPSSDDSILISPKTPSRK